METNYPMNGISTNPLVDMSTKDQMVLPSEIPFPPSIMDPYSTPVYTPMPSYGEYPPSMSTTPVVKSHQSLTIFPFYQQSQQHQSNQYSSEIKNNASMMNIAPMDIDYFNKPGIENMFPHPIQTMYSPSTNSVTTNASLIMMDTLSPTSPTHLLSPNHSLLSPSQSMDNGYLASQQYHLPSDMSERAYSDNNGMVINRNFNHHSNGMLYHEELSQHTVPTVLSERKGRRPQPRRHTVATPYGSPLLNRGKETVPMIDDMANNGIYIQNDVTQISQVKSTKKPTKAKRHRSLSRFEMSPPPVPDMAHVEPLTAKLEMWTHEQLLERVMELEKEKEEAVLQNHLKKKMSQDTGDLNIPSRQGRIRSASHTDTELDEEEEEEEEAQLCKWDDCSLELNSLGDLIQHVKIDHIGSGKANYYCGWKDCLRQQKPFTKRHKMHNHLRTHTGERPFVCREPDCGKRFSRPDSLTTHAKIHSNIRPHLCSFEYCDKAYYHLRSLRKHERTHVKEELLPNSSSPPIPVTSNVVHPPHSNLQQTDVYSDWGISTQTDIFNVIDRETSS